MELRYGLNPDQAAFATAVGDGNPLRVVAGEPSYINLLDALSGWRLVREASAALPGPVAASFKHVSPAGVATEGPLDDVMSTLWRPADAALSSVARAYVRARDCDPKSSFGDFVAISEPVDHALAGVLRAVVSDGIIAPGYEPGTVDVLAAKKGGQFLVLEVDAAFEPPAWESRDVFGVRLTQQISPAAITREMLTARATQPLPPTAVDDLLLATVAARHTQSNTITFARHGMVIGIGAGQQSRVDCTRLAGAKVDRWWLRRHPKVRSLPFDSKVRRQDRINWQIAYIDGDMDAREHERFRSTLTAEVAALTPAETNAWLARLDDVVLASDGYIPFRDNVDQAARHRVTHIVEPGGSSRNDDVSAACEQHGITHVATGLRLFHH